ncbi:MAG: hypothetical protein J6Z22_02055 [Lachnospiraceae bacterium]|nr:hypothetical protein [Lachnospiraceae bacterium]
MNPMETEGISVEELVNMIDQKMQDGVGRLSIGFSSAQETGTKIERYHHGRCDVGSPWAKGTVTNCDSTDTF